MTCWGNNKSILVELTKAQTSASAGGDTDTNALKEKSELELKIKQLTNEKEILKSDLGEIVNITYGGMIDLSFSDWIITVSHLQRIRNCKFCYFTLNP